MKMEKQKKDSARSTFITLKECLENENWQKGYEIILRDTKNRLKNHYYGE